MRSLSYDCVLRRFSTSERAGRESHDSNLRRSPTSKTGDCGIQHTPIDFTCVVLTVEKLRRNRELFGARQPSRKILRQCACLIMLLSIIYALGTLSYKIRSRHVELDRKESNRSQTKNPGSIFCGFANPATRSEERPIVSIHQSHKKPKRITTVANKNSDNPSTNRKQKELFLAFY